MDTEHDDNGLRGARSQHSRGEELGALQKAKEILEEKTGGAADRTYSFIQLSSQSKTIKWCFNGARTIKWCFYIMRAPFNGVFI